MSAKHIWGFGGVRLECAGVTAQFDYATGKLWFEPKNISNESLDGNDVDQFLGFRPMVSIDARNVSDTDYIQFVNLLAILNASYWQNQTLTIYPAYSATDDNLSYTVKCKSPQIAMEALAAVKAGQSISLTFRGTSLVTSMPGLTSDPSYYYWVYSEDGGATTDNIVDHEGNKLIFSS